MAAYSRVNSSKIIHVFDIATNYERNRARVIGEISHYRKNQPRTTYVRACIHVLCALHYEAAARLTQPDFVAVSKFQRCAVASAEDQTAIRAPYRSLDKGKMVVGKLMVRF